MTLLTDTMMLAEATRVLVADVGPRLGMATARLSRALAQDLVTFQEII